MIAAREIIPALIQEGRKRMKRGDKVRVKLSENPPETEKYYGGWIGTVVADSEPGEPVQVEFEEELDEEVTSHQFPAADLEKIEEQKVEGE